MKRLLLILTLIFCISTIYAETLPYGPSPEETAPVDHVTKSSSIMYITVNNHDLIVDLVSNSSTAALLDLLKNAPITYEAHDYGDFEKVGNIGYDLPQNNEQIVTEPGDVILYEGQNICIYYDTNEWDFTRLGKIRNITQSELRQILGDGNVMVTLSLGGSAALNAVQTDKSIFGQMYSIDGKILKDKQEKGIFIKAK